MSNHSSARAGPTPRTGLVTVPRFCTHKHTHARARARAHTHTHTHTCLCMFVSVSVSVAVSVCMCVCMYLWVCVWARVRVCVHVRMCMCTNQVFVVSVSLINLLLLLLLLLILLLPSGLRRVGIGHGVDDRHRPQPAPHCARTTSLQDPPPHEPLPVLPARRGWPDRVCQTRRQRLYFPPPRQLCHGVVSPWRVAYFLY